MLPREYIGTIAQGKVFLGTLPWVNIRHTSYHCNALVVYQYQHHQNQSQYQSRNNHQISTLSSNNDITGLPTPAGSKLHNDSRPGTPSPIYMIIITTNTIIMIVHPPSNTKQATPRIRNFLDNKHIHDQSTLCRQILLLLSSQRRKTFSKLLPLAYRPRFFCISTQVFCTLPQVFVAYRLRLFCISPHQVFRLSSTFPSCDLVGCISP